MAGSGGVDAGEGTGEGVHEVAGHAYVGCHEGMVADEVDGLAHGVVGVLETMQPAVEVNAAVAHQGDVLVADATLAHEVKHLFGVHALHSADGVADNHYLVDTELIDGHEQRAHGRVEGIGDGASCILYDFHIAVADAERGRQEFYEACVHAGDYGYFLVGVLRSSITFIAFVFHKFAVVAQYIFNHIRKKLGFLQIYKKYF